MIEQISHFCRCARILQKKSILLARAENIFIFPRISFERIINVNATIHSKLNSWRIHEASLYAFEIRCTTITCSVTSYRIESRDNCFHYRSMLKRFVASVDFHRQLLINRWKSRSRVNAMRNRLQISMAIRYLLAKAFCHASECFSRTFSSSPETPSLRLLVRCDWTTCLVSIRSVAVSLPLIRE